MDPRERHDRVAALFPGLRADLERLVELPSVALEGFPPEPLPETAEAVAARGAAGMPQVELRWCHGRGRA